MAWHKVGNLDSTVWVVRERKRWLIAAIHRGYVVQFKKII